MSTGVIKEKNYCTNTTNANCVLISNIKFQFVLYNFFELCCYIVEIK